MYIETPESLAQSYRNYLMLEKSLSGNSVEAYVDDLNKLLSFLADKNISPQDAQLEDLQELVATLSDLGINPRSQARMLSGIRSFFKYLFIERHIKSDPTDLLESPKLGLKLPVFLTVEEVNNTIATINLALPEGQRNKAMLETLYSCGLRVSELVGLHFSDCFFDEGFIKVIGKGNKQRLVPISQTAIKEINLYLIDRHTIAVKHGFEDTLFLNRRGTALTRVMVFYIVKDCIEAAGIHKTVSPHTFRHSFATHLLEGGANLRAIQAMLGHEKITTTEIYTHLDRDYLRSEIIEHHPRNQVS
ncbi:tyrosine recombinase XerC [Bacteroidia bacterium]|nr:tyrosine recombinase XerC [Bacteroidia bacterium]